VTKIDPDPRSESTERRELEARRRALENEIHGLRDEIEGRVGWTPRAAWALPLVGLAAGISLALRFGNRKSKTRKRLERRGR
jgi:hypothetical protein